MTPRSQMLLYVCVFLVHGDVCVGKRRPRTNKEDPQKPFI